MTRDGRVPRQRSSGADLRTGDDSGPGGDVEAVLEVRDLTKRYGESAALRGVSLAIDRGSITGLLGANGAGKTTLMKSILGLVIPTDGTVLVGNRHVTRDVATIHGEVAAVFEGARNVYWRLTARENLALFARLHGVSGDELAGRVDGILATVGLGPEADTLVGELSRGMKQRCALGCALVRDVPILLLDEPTLGLDVESRSALLDLLEDLARREGRTILLSSHDMDVIERLCDRAVVLENGRVVTDASVAALKSAFATRACTVTVEGSVDESAVPSVTEAYTVLDRRHVEGRTEFDVALPSSDDVYRLVDRLRRDEQSLRSVERTVPDLGTIFVELTDDGAGAA